MGAAAPLSADGWEAEEEVVTVGAVLAPLSADGWASEEDVTDALGGTSTDVLELETEEAELVTSAVAVGADVTELLEPLLVAVSTTTGGAIVELAEAGATTDVAVV